MKGERKPQEYSLEVNGKVISDLEEVSENFAHHFAAVGERIHAEIYFDTSVPTQTFVEDRGDGFEMMLEPCSELQVKKVISSIRSNSAGIDGLNLKTFKVAVSYLLPCIVFLINLSMEYGDFLDSLKIAKIIPLPKTGTLKDLSNWRSISDLPLLSKMCEKIIHKRLYNHLTKNGFLAETQFGFRKNHLRRDYMFYLFLLILKKLLIQWFLVYF